MGKGNQSPGKRPGIAALAWSLAKDLVLRPARAAETLKASPDALPASLAIYLVYLGLNVAYYSWKPVDFPKLTEGPLPLGLSTLPQGPVFWAKVQAWNPMQVAILVYFLAWFTSAVRGGRLALRIALVSLVWIVPVLAILLWAGKALPSWAVLFAWALVVIPTIPGTRARARESWRPLACFSLAISTVNLALCPFFAAAVAARSETFYLVLELAMLAWTLGLGCFVVGRLEQLPAARAFAALFFAMLAQFAAVISLFVSGLVSKDVLKALMSV